MAAGGLDLKSCCHYVLLRRLLQHKDQAGEKLQTVFSMNII